MAQTACNRGKNTMKNIPYLHVKYIPHFSAIAKRTLAPMLDNLGNGAKSIDFCISMDRQT